MFLKTLTETLQDCGGVIDTYTSEDTITSNSPITVFNFYVLTLSTIINSCGDIDTPANKIAI